MNWERKAAKGITPIPQRRIKKASPKFAQNIETNE